MDVNKESFEQEQYTLNGSGTDKEQELLLKIEELDDAWNDLNIQRRDLYNQKESMDKQATALKREKTKQQKELRKLKFSMTFVVSILYCAAVMLAGGALVSEDITYGIRKGALSFSYDKQVNALDTSCADLIQQIDDLMQQRDDLQEAIAQKEAAIAQKEADIVEEAKLEHLKEQLSSLEKEELAGFQSTVLTEANRRELDTYIASLNRYPTQQIRQKELDGISYYEVVRKYDLGKYRLSDSGNSAIYPGAIIRGDSLMQGTADYSLVSQARTPMTLTCSRGGSVQLEDVNYGTAKRAVEQLWNESDSGYSEKWEYSLHSVKDEEGLKLSLGIEADGVGSVGFGLNQKESASTMAIVYTETYFTVAAEPLGSATRYFQTGSDLKNIGNYEPAYVSSVDYGRMIVVLATADMSETELGTNLSANIKGVDIGADIGYIKTTLKGSCKIYCYGGDSAKTLQAINTDERSGGLKGWWDELINGKSSDVSGFNQIIASDDAFINPVPLSYRLNYLSDNSSVPAIAIISDNIVLEEGARLVTLTLEGNINGIFQLSDSVGAIGCVVNTDSIRIYDGVTSGEIQFIWDSRKDTPLTGTFNGTLISCPLDMIWEGENTYELDKKEHVFSSDEVTYLKVCISSEMYEIP